MGKDSDESSSSRFTQLWQTVRDDYTNFDGWIALLQYVEEKDDIKRIREAFDGFLQRYPYCYGYWKKYAELEKSHKHADRASEVYHRGVQAIPLSIDLWLSYLDFYQDFMAGEKHSEDKVRQLFARAIDAAGLDFKSDKLWEAYINWELKLCRLKNVFQLYDRLIRIPTLLYSQQYERFQEFTNKNAPDEVLPTKDYFDILKDVEAVLKKSDQDVFVVVEETEQNSESDIRQFKDETDESGDSPSAAKRKKRSFDDAPNVVELQTIEPTVKYKKQFSPDALKQFRLQILESRRKVHLGTEKDVTKRWEFETAVKRPYFHVKPLERAQLKNWRGYLDFEITEGQRQRVEVLFERCLIACAMYEDIWIKYARYMEMFDKAGAREVYQRACYTHLSKKPNLRLAWSAFEERNGDLAESHRILQQFLRQNPGMVSVQTRLLNIERRRAVQSYNDKKKHGKDRGDSPDNDGPDLTEVMVQYENLIRDTANPRIGSFYAIKYARFIDKVKNNSKLAEKILLDALERDDLNVRLHLQLIDIAFHNRPMVEDDVIAAFDRALKAKLEPDERLTISQRKLEFLEDLGSSVEKLQLHYEWHQKLYKSLGGSSSKKREGVANSISDSKPVNAQTTVPSAPPAQIPAPVMPPVAIPVPASATGFYPPPPQGFPHQWNQHGAVYYPPSY